MGTPEQGTAQQSGIQDPNATSQEQPVVTTQEPNAPAQETSTPEGELDLDKLSGRIQELQSTIQNNDGSNEDLEKAETELSEIEDKLTRMKNGEAAAAPATPAPEKTGGEQTVEPGEQGSAAQKQAEEIKRFRVFHEGNEVLRDDPNGLLGMKSTGDLKAAFIKQQLRFDAAQKQIDELNRKLAEAAAKPPTPPQQPTAQHQAPTQTPQAAQQSTQPQSTMQRPERPVAPKRPQLSSNDPLDYTDDDRQKLNSYYRDMDSFSERVVKYNEYIENQMANPRVPDSIQREIEELRQFKDRAGTLLDSVEAEKQSLAQQRADDEYWGRFSNFQGKHKSYKTPIPPRELNAKMVDWMDTVASVNGLQKPSTPKNYDDPNWQSYLANRAELVNRYNSGDATVRNNVQGFDPPEGHDTYLKLLELEGARKSYIASGVLGPKATLEDAYFRQASESGDMDKRMEALRIQERQNATRQFGDALDDMNSHASTIPPNEGAPGPDVTQYGLTEQDIAWAASIKEPQYAELQKRPKELERYQNIVAKLERFKREGL